MARKWRSIVAESLCVCFVMWVNSLSETFKGSIDIDN